MYFRSHIFPIKPVHSYNEDMSCAVFNTGEKRSSILKPKHFHFYTTLPQYEKVVKKM